MGGLKRIESYPIVVGLCAAILACSDSSTSPIGRPFQPILSVSAPTLTGRIAYTTGTIHIYNLATNTDVSLGVSGVNPKFSPDGTLITYQNSGIKVMNADGTNQRLINPTGGVPSFNPAGNAIAYDDNGIWKINIDGTGRTQLTTDSGHWAAWSPDGTQIAYGAPVSSSKRTTTQQVFIMNADGSNRHQVPTTGSVIDVVWQPSSKLLFGMSVSNGGYDLYSYDPANSSSLTRLTTSSDADDEPSWSPDGTQISWTSGTNRTGGIWTMNADGTGKQGPIISKGRQGSWGR